MGRQFLCLLAIALVGCGRLPFIAERMNNFAAYYNTYYNAEKALEEGIRNLEEQTRSQPVNQDVFLSLFGAGEGSVVRQEPFEDAVEKSANLLRNHPDTKWVDDAMVIIGKAWYYTRNFIGAAEKFEEVLTLESRLHDEARFWLARTHIASGDYSLAYDLLQATLRRDEIDQRWEPQLHLALADLHVEREEWESAEQELHAGLQGARNKDLAGRGWFLLGQVYEALGRPEDAVEAYRRVGSFRPDYELLYAAQYSAVRLQADLGDPDEAMLALRRMERDDKHFDHREELLHLRGRILQELGSYEESLEIYNRLLYDRTLRAANVHAPTHYALGVYYRDVELDYPYAAAHFDSAGRGLRVRPASGKPPQYAPGAITDSEELARVFGDYVEVLDRVVLLDSLLYLGSLDDSTFQQAVLKMRQQLRDEQEEEARLLDQQQAEAQFRGRNAEGYDTGFGGDLSTAQGEIGESGFLFHRDVARMRQAHAEFVLRWGDRPLAPNWRRRDAIMAVAEENAGLEADPAQWVTADTGDDLPIVDVSAVPRDSLARKRVVTERALARYEMGNVLFLSMSLPDSAAAWYRMVIIEDSGEAVAERAAYAVAEMHLSYGDTLAAHALYRDILSKTAGGEIAMQAAARLGVSANDFAIQDSLTLAETAYAEALSHWEGGRFRSAFDGMVALAGDYSTTTVAPRALFAAGQAYIEWAASDSLDVFAPLPAFAWPEGMVPDSTAPDSIDVTMLYERLPALYPVSREAQRSRDVAAALEKHRQALYPPADSVVSDTLMYAGLAADSTAADRLRATEWGADSLMVRADSTIGDSVLVRDTPRLTVLDTLASPAKERAEHLPAAMDIPAEMSPPVVQDSTSSWTYANLGSIDWAQGGYTLLVRTEERRADAVGFVRGFDKLPGIDNYPVDVFAVTEDGRKVFQVGLGLFATLQEAETVRQEFAAYLPDNTRAIRVPEQ